MTTTNTKPVHCSFCGTPNHKTAGMVAGGKADAAICDKCVLDAVNVLIHMPREPVKPAADAQ